MKADWNLPFIEEFTTFPRTGNGYYDDQVDTASVGYTKLTGKRTYSATWGRGVRSSIGMGDKSVGSAGHAPITSSRSSGNPTGGTVKRARAGITFGRRQ